MIMEFIIMVFNKDNMKHFHKCNLQTSQNAIIIFSFYIKFTKNMFSNWLTIIIGDFNIDMLIETPQSKMLNFVTNFSLTFS